MIAVGTELLLGDVINSNAAHLGGRLAACGVEVVSSRMVADSLDLLTEAIRLELESVDVVVLCGGLGPTFDDLTRDAIALACDAPLYRDAAVEAALVERFRGYRADLPPEVMRQADVPAGASLLENPVGTAPGLWLEHGSDHRTDHGGTVVIALPGPPHELRAVAEPVWARLSALSGSVVTTRQLLVVGAESLVARDVEAAVTLPAGVTGSYLAGAGIVRVRFTTAGDPAVLEPIIAAAATALGSDVFGQDADTLDVAVHRLLAARGETVALAESLTGGLIGAALSAMPGSSATFRGGVVVYATDLKASLAGVPADLLEAHGAVSAETAQALADGVRVRLGSDWGLAVTGVAGPAEQEGKPVGTVFAAIAGPSTTEVRALRLPFDRDRVRAVTVNLALDLLRRHLL